MSYTESQPIYPATAAVRPNRQIIVWLGRLAVIAALLPVLYVQLQALEMFVQHGREALTFAYPLNYGEGPLLDQTLRLAQGENIYPADLSTPPYTITNYPPLYILTQVPFVNTFGATYTYGRLLSLVSVLLTAVLIGLTIRALTGDWVGGLVGGLTLLTVPYVLHWSPLFRIDSLALLLSWAGLFLLAQFPRGRWAIVAAALFLTAAIFTRQSYALAAPLAGCVWLLRQPRPYRALLLALIIGNLTLWTFGLLQVLTRGGFFFHIVTANVNAFNPDLIVFYADEIIRELPLLIGASLLFLLVGLVARARAWWLSAPYIVGALGAALTIGKVGSDVNYLYELSAAFALIVGVWIGFKRDWWLLRVGLLLVLAWHLNSVHMFAAEKYNPIQAQQIAREDELREYLDIISDADGIVLVDEDIGLLPLAGRAIYLQPFEMTQLANAGIWDDAPVVAALSNRAFDSLMIYQPADFPQLVEERWTAAMRREINNYPRPERVNQTMIYRAER